MEFCKNAEMVGGKTFLSFRKELGDYIRNKSLQGKRSAEHITYARELWKALFAVKTIRGAELNMGRAAAIVGLVYQPTLPVCSSCAWHCAHMTGNTEPLWFFQWSCMDVRVGLSRKLSTEELMLLNCAVGEDS